MFGSTRRIAIALALVATAAVGLTGCTPPMPPEVRAALAERKFVCVSGDATVSFPHAVGDLAANWKDSLAGACTDMTMSLVDSGAAIQVTEDGSVPANSFLTVPFALDATVVAVNISGLTSINLNASVIEQILQNKITDWADPQIAKLNPGLGLTSEPIVVDPRIQENGKAPFVEWMQRLAGGKFDASALKSVPQLTIDDAMGIPEGGIGFIPYSVNSEAMWIPAGIVTDSKHVDESTIPADSDHINSAASQLTAQKSGTGFGVKLNPNSKPLAPAGQDKAVAPYQAVYPVLLNLTGTDSLVSRAVARFLLRQDSQGMLGASYLLPLPEAVRVVLLDTVAKGLPSAK